MSLFDLMDRAGENMEKRRKTREYLKDARRYVEEGKARYEKAYSDVLAYSYETENRMRDHYEFKQNLLKEIGEEIDPILENFKRFDIDSKIKIPEVVDMQSFDISSASVNFNLSQSLESSNDIAGSLVVNLFDLFSDADEDYYEARRAKEEARAYKERMGWEKEKLMNMKESMRTIRLVISEEKDVLISLKGKLIGIAKKLEDEMKKESFSEEEAAYLKGLHKIGEKIKGLITTRFIDDRYNVTSEYRSALDDIQKINTMLPDAPDLGSLKTVLRPLIA